ncbi:hypothetical protein BH09BAC3_BH09BAC3_00330 [soil metagenome]
MIYWFFTIERPEQAVNVLENEQWFCTFSNKIAFTLRIKAESVGSIDISSPTTCPISAPQKRPDLSGLLY